MTLLSTLFKASNVANLVNKSAIFRLFRSKEQNAFKQAVRKMGGGGEDRTFYITPTRFQYTKFKDDLHFYISLGVIPLTLLITYINIFIGPATLTEIPEDYEPKHWEYYKHPVERFISRYFHHDPQIHHEKALHYLQEQQDEIDWRRKIDKVKKLMYERNDYKGIYFIPSDRGRHYRYARKMWDDIQESHGYR